MNELNQNGKTNNNLLKIIKSDLRTYFPKGNIFKCLILAYFIPSIKIIIYYRISRFLFLRRGKSGILNTYLKYKMYKIGGNELSCSADIGLYFKLAHPTGVVIGAGSTIGNNVTIFQQVTLGSHGKNDNLKYYPTIGNNVTVFAGAKLIGGIVVGDDAIIGANSVVNKDVPNGKIAIGIPCNIIDRS